MKETDLSVVEIRVTLGVPISSWDPWTVKVNDGVDGRSPEM